MTDRSSLPARKPSRGCMPCTACCDGWLNATVFEHSIRPGHGCPHRTPQGCGVYSERPHSPCRTFVCSWVVEGSPLPEKMRPDLSKAIVSLAQYWEGELVISAIPVGERIPAATLLWLQAYARQKNRPFIYYQRVMEGDEFVGLHRFGYGPPQFRQKVARLQAEGRLTPPSMDDQTPSAKESKR